MNQLEPRVEDEGIGTAMSTDFIAVFIRVEWITIFYNTTVLITLIALLNYNNKHKRQQCPM